MENAEKKLIKQDGIPYEFLPADKPCPKCGSDKYNFKWLESNRSIQQRCQVCDAWIACAKYDFRPKDEIAREAKKQFWNKKNKQQETVKANDAPQATNRFARRSNDTYENVCRALSFINPAMPYMKWLPVCTAFLHKMRDIGEDISEGSRAWNVLVEWCKQDCNGYKGENTLKQLRSLDIDSVTGSFLYMKAVSSGYHHDVFNDKTGATL